MKMKKTIGILVCVVMLLLATIPSFAYTGEVTVSAPTIGSWYGNATSNEDGTYTLSAKPTAGGDSAYLRGVVGATLTPGVDSIKTVSVDITPFGSVSSTKKIFVQQRDMKLINSSSTSSTGKLEIARTRIEPGKANRLTAVYTVGDDTVNTNMLIYINGVYCGKTSAARTAEVVRAYGTFVFGDLAQPSEDGAYGYTFSNPSAKVYPADATLDEVLLEVGMDASLDDGVLWSGVPTITNRSSMTVTATSDGYSLSNNTSTGSNIKITPAYTDVPVYGTGAYLVQKLHLKNGYSSNFTSVSQLWTNEGGKAYPDGNWIVKGGESYITIINDLKNTKVYYYVDNMPVNSSGTKYTALSSSASFSYNVLYFSHSAAFTGEFAVIDDLSATVYSSKVTLEELQSQVVEGYLRKTSIGALTAGASVNDDGSFNWSVPATTDNARFNVQIRPHVPKGHDYAVDTDYIHVHYDVTSQNYTSGKSVFASSHNLTDYLSAYSDEYTVSDPSKTYSVDIIFDFKGEMDYVYVNGVLLDRNGMQARAACGTFRYVGMGTGNAEGANVAKLSNCYIDYYYDNNTEITSLNALVAKIFTGGTKAVEYNFVNDAVYADGKYTFSKEIFGFDGENRLCIAAAYDTDNTLLGYTMLENYNGEDTIETGIEAEKIRIFIWDDDSLKPLVKDKKVGISQ